MLNFVKLPPLVAKLFFVDGRTDGHTDMTKLIVAFRNFAKAPENVSVCACHSQIYFPCNYVTYVLTWFCTNNCICFGLGRKVLIISTGQTHQ
jgi:hypothetical protein